MNGEEFKLKICADDVVLTNLYPQSSQNCVMEQIETLGSLSCYEIKRKNNNIIIIILKF